MSGNSQLISAGAKRPISLSGSLSVSAVGPTLTSATVTVTVPGGNSGDLLFHNYVDVGTITNLQYSKNGGAYVIITDGTTVNFANGDTLAVRTNGVAAGESRQWDLTDQTTSIRIAQPIHTGV